MFLHVEQEQKWKQRKVVNQVGRCLVGLRVRPAKHCPALENHSHTVPVLPKMVHSCQGERGPRGLVIPQVLWRADDFMLRRKQINLCTGQPYPPTRGSPWSATGCALQKSREVWTTKLAYNLLENNHRADSKMWDFSRFWGQGDKWVNESWHLVGRLVEWLIDCLVCRLQQQRRWK